MSSNAHAQHGHDAHDHGDHSDHVLPARTLLGTWIALMVLTGITVGATSVDLGGTLNFVIAMIVATIKAGIVLAIFMHLLYDQKYNVMVFIAGILALVLFVGIALMDVHQYQPAKSKREAVAPFKVPGVSAPAQP